MFFSCYICARRDKKYNGVKSIKSERNDGYVVLYYSTKQLNSMEFITTATCKNLNVSFIFGVLDWYYKIIDIRLF